MADERYRLLYRARYALRNPDRIVPYLQRLLRDLRIRLRHRDHVDYYREVMRHDVAEHPDRAVGSRSRARWMALGQMQFDFLTANGLRPDHDVLEIGCGNLRGGWRLIEHLEVGRYTGLDISPDILLAANRTIVEFGLQEREPRLHVVDDLRFDWLPAERFDVVHAHSVFSHTPLEVIDQCFANVGRIMRPGGFFDLTFNETHDKEHQVLREDFYYRVETLLELARRYGFEAEPRRDWPRTHKQSRIRLRKPADAE